MTTTSANNIFNNDLFKNKGLTSYKPFGLNVHVPETTLEKISASVKASVAGNLNAIQSYLATNDDVFSGKVSKQIQSLEHESVMTSNILNAAEPKTARKFEMHM